MTTAPQADYDKSMTTRKNVRRGALRPQQKADLRSLRLAFIATLPRERDPRVGLGDDADRCVDQGAACGLSNGDPDAMGEKASGSGCITPIPRHDIPLTHPSPENFKDPTRRPARLRGREPDASASHRGHPDFRAVARSCGGSGCVFPAGGPRPARRAEPLQRLPPGRRGVTCDVTCSQKVARLRL